jgi:hypothetical protein
MSEFHTLRSTKRTARKEAVMSIAAEASSLLRRVAEPRPVGDSVKAAISRAARRVSRFMAHPMTHGRAEDIWRQEARIIRAEEMDAIRKAAADTRLLAEGRDALAQIDARIARLEALLLQDEDFHGPQVAAHRAALRGPDRPLD